MAEQLSRGNTLAKAAEAAGCSLNTAKRRWAEPWFRNLVIQLQEDARREREAYLHAAWQLGTKLLQPALIALQDTLQDPTASHLDRARAARVVLRSYGPKEEPPAPMVPTVEQEQQSAAMAAQVRQLLARANVVDLDTRRPTPPRPAPVAREQSWTPPAAVGAWPIDDEDQDQEAAGVGQEYAKTAPPEPLGPPEPPPEVAEGPDDEDPDDTDPASQPWPAAAEAVEQPPEAEPRETLRWVSEGGARVRRLVPRRHHRQLRRRHPGAGTDATAGGEADAERRAHRLLGEVEP